MGWEIRYVCSDTVRKTIPNPFVKEKGMAGHAWVEGFLHRNPMI
jgi:hypothetical protein